MANDEQIYLKINGVAMPTPTKYEYTEADFDSPDSHRSETGVMIRDPIRFDCHTVKCTWNAIKNTDLRKLKTRSKLNHRYKSRFAVRSLQAAII